MHFISNIRSNYYCTTLPFRQTSIMATEPLRLHAHAASDCNRQASNTARHADTLSNSVHRRQRLASHPKGVISSLSKYDYLPPRPRLPSQTGLAATTELAASPSTAVTLTGDIGTLKAPGVFLSHVVRRVISMPSHLSDKAPTNPRFIA